MATLMAVSSKHTALLALNHHRLLNNSLRTNGTMVNVVPAHAGMNVLLGGAMMSCLLIMVVCICYLCHWRYQKAEERVMRRHSWIQVPDQETPIHVFTLGSECYEDMQLPNTQSSETIPPPDYETVVGEDSVREQPDRDLPSYETAMKLSGSGYV